MLDETSMSTSSLCDVELLGAELFRGSRRLIRSRLSSGASVDFSMSLFVVMLKACLNSSRPDVVPTSAAPDGLDRDWAPGSARTLPSSGVFLPWGLGIVILQGTEWSSGYRLSQFGEWVSVCTGSWKDEGLSQV